MDVRLVSFFIITVMALAGCGNPPPANTLSVMDVNGLHPAEQGAVWLSHEHILVDFIGADSIDSKRWDRQKVIMEMAPLLGQLKQYHVRYFVDATPAYLGRDVKLLKELSDRTGIRIITNTGLYGTRGNQFIPQWAMDISATELAARWIAEFEDGIDGTEVKPGFIKIGVDAADPLDPVHQKLVKAAALTHLKTGLTIASHTGKAVGLWPQLAILKEAGVSPEAFIWVHAQNEENNDAYLKAAEAGCWISLDGLGWELDRHLEKILFAREHDILDKILISHDAGWYDPQKEIQEIKAYTNIFTKLYPALKSRGFTDAEFHQLLSGNPSKALAIRVRSIVMEND